MKLDHLLTSYKRINSKWIKDLKVSHKTIKILEVNIGSKISTISHSNIIANISPKALDTKEKINKWEYIRLKDFCTANEIKSKGKIFYLWENSPTVWENVFTNDTSDKGLVSKIYKELIQLNTRKTKKSN